MQRKVRLGSAVVMTVVAGAAGFMGGGFHGFNQGTSSSLYAMSAEAAQTALVLRSLRADQLHEAISLLESSLGSQLLLNTVGRDSHASIFNLLRWLGIDSADTIDSLAARGAAYWLHHAQDSEHSLATDAARTILKRIGDETAAP